jgi:hypothetical protein
MRTILVEESLETRGHNGEGELKGLIFRHIKRLERLYSKSGKCLYPMKPACTTKPCRAHSIQNRVVLDSLAEEGHVVVPKLDFSDIYNPSTEFQRVGQNVATVFTGLCARHDAELFAPIEKKPLDLKDREQMFLLAYRAVLRETHTVNAMAQGVEEGHNEGVGLGFLGMEAIAAGEELKARCVAELEHIAEQKRLFDQAYLSRDYETVEYEVAWTPPSPPGLAVNSFFSIGVNKLTGKDMPVALNVLPFDGKHAVVISFRRASKPLAQNLIFSLKSTTNEERFRAVSRLVLKDCENFVLRPSLYTSFGREQKRLIGDYFLKTMGVDKLGGYEVEPFPGAVNGSDVEKLNLLKSVGL